jgi:hypothetical protein
MQSLFNIQDLLALMRLHVWATVAIISTLISIAAIAYFWEKVAYFVMRVWHGVPLIGTVSRLSRETAQMKDGWPSVELNLCEAYANEYKKYLGDSSLYRKGKDYLAKIGEAGRKPMPLFILALALILLVVEAVGFGFVLGPFVNSSASANQMEWLAWSVAFLLALISGGFAHFAGHHIHYNTLVKKAHAWWARDGKNPDRPSSLKQLQSLDLDDTYADNDKPDYLQIMARINADHNVNQKKGVIYGFFVVIILLSIAAFAIRAYTLESIETEMVADLSSASVPSSTASPFDLPAESASLNDQAEHQSIQDKMNAVRSASLVTYIVLSIVYIAIQCLMLWLSVVYGFAGVSSKEAWGYSSEFKSAEELDRWLVNQRARIAGHADHKLRYLQQKRSSRHTTLADEQDAMATDLVDGRNFLAYVRLRKQETARHDENTAATDREAQRVKTAATAPAPGAQDAATFHDVTAMSDAQLESLGKALKMDIAALKDVREQQRALQVVGLFGKKDVAPAAAVEPAPEPVAEAEEVDAASFKDLTSFDQAQLAIASKAMKIALATLTDIRDQQVVLKQLGMFGSKEPA